VDEGSTRSVTGEYGLADEERLTARQLLLRLTVRAGRPDRLCPQEGFALGDRLGPGEAKDMRAVSPRRITTATNDTVRALAPSWPLMEAKLEAPGARRGTVGRRRLISQLVDDPARVVTLIAPPGYGKTTVLALWAARDARPVAWLTLDDLDNDPAVLVRSLVASLARIGPMDPSIIRTHAASRHRILGATIPRLVSDIHRWQQPALLVLDDAHRIDRQTSLDALTALLDHLPSNLAIAIAGRTEPALPFGRLRARRDLLEIGPHALALDIEETAALARATGCVLDDESVRELNRRTEGWPVAIYLAALASRRAGPDAGVTMGLTGGDHYVSSYLASELAAGLGEGDMQFLTRTAIVEIVTPGLAEVLSGMPDGGPRLASLARSHLLIQEAGQRPTAFRYHNLLRDFLLEELDRREPGRALKLHRIAAEWYRDSGTLDLAIQHAFAGDDLDTAASLIETAGPPLHDRGHLATVERWLGRLTTSEFERHPTVAVLAAWVHLLTGRPSEAMRMAELVDRTDPTTLVDTDAFEPQRAMLRAVVCAHGPRHALAEAAFAVESAQADSQWRANALWLLAAAQTLLGDVEAAEHSLGEAIADATYGAHLSVGAWARHASLKMRRADWDGATEAADEALRRLYESQYEDVLPALSVLAVSARAAAHRGESERARELLVEAQLVRPLASHAAPWLSVTALLDVARAYLAVSDPAGAQVALREAEQIVRRRPALGKLTEDLIEIRKHLAGSTATLVGSSALTNAELRILPLLPTYLSFQEIADRLGVSRNTVKTHAMSIYGKVWATSRGEAVEQAVALGLLEPYPGLEPAPNARAKADNGADDGPALAS
jgi:LuxR family maltose regulon positive regulatory protein